MDMHLLDAFAAHSAGMTLDEFTRAQRTPATRVHRAPTRRRRAAVALSTTLGVAAPALTVVVLTVR